LLKAHFERSIKGPLSENAAMLQRSAYHGALIDLTTTDASVK